jgi:hypothetical protein
MGYSVMIMCKLLLPANMLVELVESTMAYSTQEVFVEVLRKGYLRADESGPSQSFVCV